ncbi:MAG: HlyD family type I secretion periplasmic adaptor subunit [Novosphingobium sp.]|jgi:HlyD family secretion protein|uniref:HlyD family type I secretion periplasmic adaptor subunit n=1 Tax=Novosphingobium sp. TaxID=1874826 RepID=UPI0022CC113F|nr:HlyD family type I secretion periplasmic adaptor subunit [Novosphingobium sp.]MCZ8036339.1 HlyD family type I secretion periplasmic adaptor subunit [Novosphingobium sp.]
MTSVRDDDKPGFSGSLRRLALVGSAGVILFAGTIGVWAVTTTLSGAVVATGQFVVDGNVKKVQHATGGVVGELRVREGDRVQQDQIVIRLDDTVTRANLQVITKQLDEYAARRARLQAERDRKAAVTVAPELLQRIAEPEIADLVAAEHSLFEARRTARDGQKAQLAKRMGQLSDEIRGLQSQQSGRDRQAVLIEEELLGVRGLYAKNLVSLSRKTQLEREAASLEGQKGQLIAAVAQAEGKIAETQLQIIQIDDTLREEVMKELREIQGKTAELIERRIAAEDQLKRIDIRAPSAGFVHQLAVHTVGGVITPAEPAMLIVPAEDALQVEARINPPDIDQVALGQPAQIKLHAFNQRTTPELAGTVSRISADTSRDQQTGAIFYTIRVSVSAAELARLAPNRIAAGMQADVFVKTEDRTPLEFIVKPLKDQIAKAFRER